MQIAENKTFVLQTELALYCRTGKKPPKTTIQEHTFQYRRLVFSVVKNTLKNAFPLSIGLMGKKRWKKSVVHFFENHKCQTPQVWRLPEEFFEYYNETPFPFKKEFPFIKELLHYEWLEIEVFMMEDLPIDDFKTKNDSENEVIVPNPEVRILPLTYPIHTKKVKKIKSEDKGQYFVSIHRDYTTKQVRFNDLSYHFVELLVKINKSDLNELDLLQILGKYEEEEEISKEILSDFLAFSIQNNLILGYRINN